MTEIHSFAEIDASLRSIDTGEPTTAKRRLFASAARFQNRAVKPRGLHTKRHSYPAGRGWRLWQIAAGNDAGNRNSVNERCQMARQVASARPSNLLRGRG